MLRKVGLHRLRSNNTVSYIEYILCMGEGKTMDLGHRLEVTQGHTFWLQSTDHA